MDSVIFARLSILPLGIKNKREHKDKHDCATVTDRIFFFFLRIMSRIESKHEYSTILANILNCYYPILMLFNKYKQSDVTKGQKERVHTQLFTPIHYRLSHQNYFFFFFLILFYVYIEPFFKNFL